MGVSEPTFYRWKKQFVGMGVPEIRRLKQLEDENGIPSRSSGPSPLTQSWPMSPASANRLLSQTTSDRHFRSLDPFMSFTSGATACSVMHTEHTVNKTLKRLARRFRLDDASYLGVL
jgi:hypothetical protein